MSNTQFSFLKKENVPGKEAWQKAIDSLDFKIRLGIDPELAPFEDEGFSPCGWGDTDDDVGFEIYYEPREDIYLEDEELKSIIGDRDYCISMVWRGSMKDCAAVMIASSALAQEFDAIVSYEGQLPVPVDELIKGTHEVIIDAEKEA